MASLVFRKNVGWMSILWAAWQLPMSATAPYHKVCRMFLNHPQRGCRYRHGGNGCTVWSWSEYSCEHLLSILRITRTRLEVYQISGFSSGIVPVIGFGV